MTDEDQADKMAGEDLARLRVEYSANEVVRALPQPGERHNASGIPVSDLALAILLSGTRAAEVLNPCREPDCEACNELHLIWWDCCNALSRTARLMLQTRLRADGYGLPDAPWEDLAQVDREGGVGYQSVEE